MLHLNTNGDLKALEKFSAAGKFACGDPAVSGAETTF